MLQKSIIKNVEDFMCAPDISIREAMVRITGKILLFQIVVDENQKILGTLTDGDFRRAILRGITLDEQVRVCMNASPVTGKVGEDEENARKLEQIYEIDREHGAFLPITDKDGKLDSIHIYELRRAGRPRALIMAGGLGSRLGERTKNTPKPMLNIGDKPILEHIIDRLEKANIEKIYISVRYLAEQIEDFIEARKGRSQITVIREATPLGTAGAIGLLPKSIDEPFLIINGDVMTKVDYSALFAFHDRHEYDATITVAQHRVQIPFGVVLHSEDGLFKGIDEKPNQEHFIAAGIYILSPEFRSLIPPIEQIDMPALLNKGQKLGFKIGLFPIHEYWTDIGRPEDFELANTDYGKS